MVMMYEDNQFHGDKRIITLVTDTFSLLEAMNIQSKILFNNNFNNKLVQLHEFNFVIGTIGYDGTFEFVEEGGYDTVKLYDNPIEKFISVLWNFQKFYDIAYAFQNNVPLFVQGEYQGKVGIYKIIAKGINKYIIGGLAKYEYK